ncbi:MAG: molybdopterin-dependent oxidoreductase [Deltaproteobacteria bacterium]|nr:molybdopterin-dependent oxidoreductase [Deltaproteobacteria bacterium]
MDIRYVGKSVVRVDGLEKVTGRAVYSVDVELPGMLYGAVLRSPVAHGRIVGVDVAEARKVAGVRAVVTGKDFPYTFGNMIKDQPFLAFDRVRYVGEPVVAVAAETELAAQVAVGRVRVEYEELPAVFDPREAIAKGAPLIHEHLEEYFHLPRYEIVPGTNICVLRTYSLGDMEKGFAEADEIVADDYYAHPVAHTPMEPHAAVAQYLPFTEEFTIWSSTDRPHTIAKELAAALGTSLNKVRYISTYSGGGFGGKGTMVAEAIAVALARFTKGRPVKVVLSREEELTASQTRVGAYLKLTTGVKRDGTITARKAEMIWDSGAYASWAPDVAFRGALQIMGPYRVPNLELRSRLVYTNKEISGAYRGFGTTQVTWACEVHMDSIAEKLGLDPLEIRLKNGYVEGDPYINGQILRGVGMKETLKRASREIGWGEAKPSLGGSKRRGKGIAVTIKPTATPTESYCFIKLYDDGGVTLLSSAVEVGCGQKTVLAQMAADTIGVPLASISVPQSDTHLSPYDLGVCSSRTTYHMGNAVIMAGMEVRKKILKFAGEILEADPESLNLSEGKIFQKGAGEARISLKELLAKKIGGRGGSILVGEGHYTPVGSPLLAALPGREGMSSIFWMFATHAAEVEVDTETGIVKVLKVAAAHDVGKAIHPVLCEQQIEGSVIMGLSNTLFEEFKMEKGRILNDTLSDYKVASTLDTPEIVSIIVETEHPEAPFGAKGVGEPAAAPTGPAIANAIFDAIGVRFKDLPITPEKVLSALSEKNKKEA